MGLRRRMLLALAIGVAFAGVASAASLGTVTSARLDGVVGTGPSGAKTVYASDHFTGLAGTNLSGRPLVIGQTWVIGASTWLLSSANDVEVQKVVGGRAVTATGQANVRIVLTVQDSGAGGRTTGVVLRSDATAARYLSVYSLNGNGGKITLAKRDGNTTALTSFTGVNFTNPATWVVEVNGSNVRALYNGTEYINYTLTAADQTMFGGLTSHGMLNDNSGVVRFDDFRVESL